MTFFLQKGLSLFSYVNFPYVHVGLDGQQSCTQEDELSLGQAAEVGEA
jgi:hypothetical protein